MDIQKHTFTCRRNGLRIRGIAMHKTGERLPIAIVCHGFMANAQTVMQYVRFFAHHGYAAFTFDFCGGSVVGGKSDGRTVDMSVLTEVEDLRAVVEYAAAQSYTDEQSITLMGCSQGGFVCALTAAQLKTRINKLVLFYPAFCIPDDARRGKMMFAKFDPSNPPAQVYCGPMKLGKRYITDVITMDPFLEILPYAGDVLIVHGTKDNIVAPQYAEAALAAYRSRPTGSVSLFMLQDGRHMFSKKHDSIALLKLEEFISDQKTETGIS